MNIEKILDIAVQADPLAVEVLGEVGGKAFIAANGIRPQCVEKFAELIWKAAYEEGHDVGVDAGFEAGRNASFTEQNFGVEE